MKIFTDEPLIEIYNYIKTQLHKETIEFQVLIPDLGMHLYSGASLNIAAKQYTYRSYTSYSDIAQFFGLFFCTPQAHNHLVTLRYKRLRSNNSFHIKTDDIERKYGKNSLFSKIDKSQESSFLFWFVQALEHAKITQKSSILNLGINSGDEFEIIKQAVDHFERFSLSGVDFCQSAIEQAQKRFSRAKLYCHNINDLQSLNLPKQDLIISVGTLQSPQIDFDRVLRFLVKELTHKKSAIVLGFPNCRWIDGEKIYGAKAKNYAFSELSLVLKDIAFAKRYLQQQKFRVSITGKDYLFLTANKI